MCHASPALKVQMLIHDALCSCSALRLLLRVVPHWLLLTPKSPLLPPMPPRVLPLFVFLTILSNVLGFFLHAFLHAPVSTAETTRGYLHGSLAIDFVGEKGPISKWRLGALDLLVMALQMAMVGLVLETRRLEKTIRDSGNAATAGQPNGDSPDGENRQDVEAEERGVRRSSEGYELRRLDSISAPNASEDGDEPRDEDDPLNTAQPPAVLAERELDALRSARALIADVSLSEAFWKLTRMHFSLELG